ncbi:MAG: putative glycoside hydrolase [Candidatus Pacebacteria bacterium]|nr:putative glycoside hydrolase [Candidatus Paceibacterota bacterium]
MKNKIIFFILILFLTLSVSFLLFKNTGGEEEVIENKVEVKMPENINAIYLTSSYLTSEIRFQKIISLIEETEINAVVIDVKDFSGKIYLNIENEELNKYGALQSWVKMDEIVKKLNEKNIYTIARIAVFEDPILSNKNQSVALKDKQGNLWRTYAGAFWVDPNSKEVWDYNILVAKEASKIGFNEINFDYIRFPSDGALSNIDYSTHIKTKREVMIDFYSYLSDSLKNIIISADLFGLTTIIDDIGVGQNIEDASKYFNYVCPMVYPSHYAKGFDGFIDPSEYPYEIVFKSLSEGNKKIDNIRPWLQAFNLLGYEYKREQIQEQIQASKDALLDNYSGYMLWNSQNSYNIEDL